MRHGVIYDIIKDGDRHLRGRIAELIFERVKSQLLKRTLYCCSTLDLYRFFNYDSCLIDSLPTNEKSLLSKYVKNLNTVRRVIGIGKYKRDSNTLSSEDLRRNLRRLCLFCLKEGENWANIWVNSIHSFPLHLCSGCLEKCIKKELIRSKIFQINSLTMRLTLKIRSFIDLLET
jgi:hypothetical protein